MVTTMKISTLTCAADAVAERFYHLAVLHVGSPGRPWCAQASTPRSERQRFERIRGSGSRHGAHSQVSMKTDGAARHRVVIVGGGAGGLELATRLGDRFGKRGQRRRHADRQQPDACLEAEAARDRRRQHGHLARTRSTTSRSAHWHRFRYRIGEMIGLDRAAARGARRAVARRRGPRGHARSAPSATTRWCIARRQPEQRLRHAGRRRACDEARDRRPTRERFHARMVNACIRAHAQATPLRPEQLKVAIIGAGATGVELAAELHRTTREVVAYGLDRVDPDKDIKVSVIEAADRVLPALPPRLSQATRTLLRKLGVEVHTAPRSPRCCATACGWPTAACMPGRAGGVGGRRQGARLPEGHRAGWRPTASTSWSSGRPCRPRATTTSSPSATAPPAPGPSQRRPGGWCRRARRRRTSRPRTCRRRSSAGWPASRCGLPLPRFRLARLARRVQHGRQHDGRADRRQPDDRRPFRAHDVRVALQDARTGAARLLPRWRSTRSRASSRGAPSRTSSCIDAPSSWRI